MLEDSRLKVFETVAKLGSFTLAARELGITQPAVSQNIAELERQLDQPLFVRERGHVSLTDKGMLFKNYVDQILHWYRAAENAFKGSNVFDKNDGTRKPVVIPLDEDNVAQIWSSQGDIHISVKKSGQE
ncbi:MAG: LysR family transcriptional regulator [Bacteroidales bacterium]|nr:LysR family transcriptional regulator [Bacteroidales bacterium]